MPLYKRGDTWWIDVRVGGRRVRRSTGTADRKEAQRQHDQLADRRWQIKQGGRQLSDALLAWLDHKPRTPSALAALKQIRAAYADRRLIDVTEASLIDTFGDKKPGTYNKLIAVIRSALNVARERGWIDSPPRLKRRPEPLHRLRFLSAEEWQALRAQLAPHLRTLAEFSIATGLRWENAAGLTWDRVSLTRKLAWIPRDTTKGGNDIAVPLSGAAVEALESIPGKREGYVFKYKGKRLASPKTGFRAACRRAGLGKDVTWHTLRRTWASWHAMNGTPLDVLQKLGGWQSREMVQVYAVLANSYVDQFAGNAVPTTMGVVTKLDTKQQEVA